MSTYTVSWENVTNKSYAPVFKRKNEVRCNTKTGVESIMQRVFGNKIKINKITVKKESK